MGKPSLHGIDLTKAVSPREVQRDSRTLGQRIAAATRQPGFLGIICFVLAGLAWRIPALVDVAALGGVVIGILTWRLQPELPLKLPTTYRGLDPHEFAPGTRRPRRARGLLFLGNDRTTGEELYLSDEDMRTHLLVLGGTGSGKTETMISLGANTLLWGSGFSYVDGKGDAALWTKVFALARACGREDDLLVLNYLTGSTDVDPTAPGAPRLSNTFSPFLHGSADALTQMLITQMAEAGGDSASWKDKAIGLLTAYVRVLVTMRDGGCDECGRPFVLDVGALRTYIALDRLIDLYLRARDRVDDFTLTDSVLESLQTYLESVPGFQDPARLLETQRQTLTPEIIRARAYPPQPDPQTYLQHGYLQNQFNRMFGQLADVYGHIFRVGHGEIDLTDVVLQRRILVGMLPALEKSPDELASLGKLLVAGVKTMLAIGLGARLEGTHRAVIESRLVAAPSPYLGVFDEYGYYPVKGFAVVPAQARTLGYGACFGGQDLQSFGKESQEEAAAIVANTLTKVGMFVEDPKDTAELFEKLGGQALAVQSSGMTQSVLAGFYRNAPNAGFERRARIDPLDLRAQQPGEAHILRGTTIIRVHLFFAGVLKAAEYRINRFIALNAPEADDAAHWIALTPESVRAGVAQVVRLPLEALQMPSVQALLASLASRDVLDDPLTDAGPSHPQTFAQRLIACYLGEHAELDAEFAAWLREVAASRSESPSVKVIAVAAEPTESKEVAAPGEAPVSSELFAHAVAIVPGDSTDALPVAESGTVLGQGTLESRPESDPLAEVSENQDDPEPGLAQDASKHTIQAAVKAVIAKQESAEIPLLEQEDARSAAVPMKTGSEEESPARVASTVPLERDDFGYLNRPVEQPGEAKTNAVPEPEKIDGRDSGPSTRPLNSGFIRWTASAVRPIAVDRLEDAINRLEDRYFEVDAIGVHPHSVASEARTAGQLARIPPTSASTAESD